MTLSLCFTVFVLFLGGSTTHLAVLLRLSIFSGMSGMLYIPAGSKHVAFLRG